MFSDKPKNASVAIPERFLFLCLVKSFNSGNQQRNAYSE